MYLTVAANVVLPSVSSVSPGSPWELGACAEDAEIFVTSVSAAAV